MLIDNVDVDNKENNLLEYFSNFIAVHPPSPNINQIKIAKDHYFANERKF
jgi:hypothetical protein